VPHIRPFRALRFDPSVVGDLSAVIAPPYDVIDDVERSKLVARHPANVVRLDLPAEEPGDEPDQRYRRAARTLATWRSEGVLRKDPHPSVYVYEQTYCVPGSAVERKQRGFFARLRLEPLDPGSAVLPHERTLAGPKEDRYKLLRATGVNTSPVVALYQDAGGRAAQVLDELTRAAPAVDVVDDDQTRHRLWAYPGDGSDGEPDSAVASLLTAAGRGPLTIADGHHRYETALRYRDERRMTRSCEEDPAFDYLLVLLIEAGEPLTVLATHRLVRVGEGMPRAGLLDRAAELFEVRDGVAREQLLEAFETPGEGGRGRFGVWIGGPGAGHGAILTADRARFGGLLGSGGEAVRRLDVTLLGVALDQLVGVDRAAVSEGAVGFTKSARAALDAVDRGDEFDLAFLLEPTPIADTLAVAAEGDVMPQKSTYFHPKALTGLVINPHEW